MFKEFLRVDYRGLADYLADQPDLTSLIGLKVVPHFTTFHKAAARLLKRVPGQKMFDAVLDKALRDKIRKWRVPRASVDGTGLESRHVSRYYVKRRSSSGDRSQEITYAKYPKAVLVVDCKSHMILAAVPGRGPCSDLVQFRRAWVKQSSERGLAHCWLTLASTLSGPTSLCGPSVSGRSFRQRGAGRRTSRR